MDHPATQIHHFQPYNKVIPNQMLDCIYTVHVVITLLCREVSASLIAEVTFFSVCLKMFEICINNESIYMYILFVSEK